MILIFKNSPSPNRHCDNENHKNVVNETLNMVECKQDIASAPNPTLPRRPTLMLINESESVCID